MLLQKRDGVVLGRVLEKDKFNLELRAEKVKLKEYEKESLRGKS